MSALLLHDFHAGRGATFTTLNGVEAVASYSSFETEYQAATQRAALLDLSFRGRVCLVGSDREKFLHGQVTNDVSGLKIGQGCYAALVTAKAKMETDLFVYRLADELLLDFEPGLTERVTARLNRFIIAEDVQVVDVSPHYGLLAAIGPNAKDLLEYSRLKLPIAEVSLGWKKTETDIYVVNNSRYGIPGYDVFVPLPLLEETAQALQESAFAMKGQWVGFNTAEVIRIENGVPRFGADMNENTIPQEAELQDRAISFSKGCYIGQEIIARIRTYGQVARALRVLRLSAEDTPPAAGVPLLSGGKNVGTITSSTFSPKYQSTMALGYVRKEVFAPGTKVQVGDAGTEAEIVGVPGKA